MPEEDDAWPCAVPLRSMHAHETAHMAKPEEDGFSVLTQEDAAKKNQHVQIADFTTVSLCRPQFGNSAVVP